MPRKSKTAEEEGLIRTFWDEAVMMETEVRRLVLVTIIPTARKGVISVQVSATAIESDSDGVIRSDKISQIFPNATSVSFAGFLWSMAQRLREQIENDVNARGQGR